MWSVGISELTSSIAHVCIHLKLLVMVDVLNGVVEDNEFISKIIHAVNFGICFSRELLDLQVIC